jgi:hypothetical protein
MILIELLFQRWEHVQQKALLLRERRHHDIILFYSVLQVQESKALVEALKGREALGLRLQQLMAGEDVDQLAAAGKRLYGKLSDRNSVSCKE